MSKSVKIIGGIIVFVIGVISLAVLKELKVGGVVYGVAVFLFLIVFSRVTGWKYGRKEVSQNDIKVDATSDRGNNDTLSEKTCPKCKKGYDRSWGVCLTCQVQLIDNAKKAASSS